MKEHNGERRTGERDIGEIIRTLCQAGIVTRGELLSLGRAPRSARALEIPDRIDETAVRLLVFLLVPSTYRMMDLT